MFLFNNRFTRVLLLLLLRRIGRRRRRRVRSARSHRFITRPDEC